MKKSFYFLCTLALTGTLFVFSGIATEQCPGQG